MQLEPSTGHTWENRRLFSCLLQGRNQHATGARVPDKHHFFVPACCRAGASMRLKLLMIIGLVRVVLTLPKREQGVGN